MFDRLKERVKSWMQKAGADTGLSKEFKDILIIKLINKIRNCNFYCIRAYPQLNHCKSVVYAKEFMLIIFNQTVF